MKPISNDAIITFFDGFTKSAYMIYNSDEGGYNLSIEKSQNRFFLNGKLLFEYLNTKFDFSYDVDEMLTISHDLSMTKSFEHMLEYFWRICDIFREPNVVIQSSANQEFNYWNLSNDAKISYYIGMSWLFHRDEKNREQRLLDFYLVVKDHLKLTITKERINELIEYFWYDNKIEEIRLKAFEILQIKHCLSGNLKHMDKTVK